MNLQLFRIADLGLYLSPKDKKEEIAFEMYPVPPELSTMPSKIVIQGYACLLEC
jgi:hypothetical protein